MRNLKEKSEELENQTAEDIRGKLKKYKREYIGSPENIRKIDVNLGLFYDFVHEFELYSAYGRLFVASAIEYDFKIYYEIVEMDNFDEFGLFIDGLTVDGDRVVFEASIEFNKE